jgi:L-aminoadipate-semialdehyde dehydrogenase
MSLYQMAVTDLPNDTIAPEQDDNNASAALRSDIVFTGEDKSAGSTPTTEIMGNCLGYLVGLGFLDKPTGEGKEKLPVIKISDKQKEALLSVGGRGAVA